MPSDATTTASTSQTLILWLRAFISCLLTHVSRCPSPFTVQDASGMHALSHV
jgi:hypothetical protein